MKTQPAVVLQYEESLQDCQFDYAKQDIDTAFDWNHLVSTDTLLQRKKKLGGLLLFAKSWDIISLDGVQEIQSQRVIYVKAPSAYKGLDDYLGKYSLIFEIKLLSLSGLALYVLLCSPSITKADIPELDAEEIERCVRSGLIDAINQLEPHRSTKVELGYRYDKRVLIYPDDWNEIGQALAYAIEEHFPYNSPIPQAQVYFIVTGDNLGIRKPKPYHFKGLKSERSIATVICNTMEYYVEQHILWWRTRDLEITLEISPQGGYQRVAAIAGLGNAVFKSNDSKLVRLECRTKIFEELRRDSFGLFQGNGLTKLISDVYQTMLNFVTKKEKPPLSRAKQLMTNNGFMDMLHHSLNSVPSTVPAYMEFTYKSTASPGELVPPIMQLVDEAADYTLQWIHRGTFGQPRTILHEMCSTVFRCRHESIMLPLMKTLQTATDYMEHYRYADNVFDYPSTNMNLKYLWKIYVANAILRYYFYGSFCKDFNYQFRLPLHLTSQTFAVQKSEFMIDWPFKEVKVVNGEIEPPDQENVNIPGVTTLYCVKRNRLIEQLREQLNDIRGLHLMDDDTNNLRTWQHRFCESILELILVLSLEAVSIPCENATSTYMLKLLWENPLKLERSYMGSKRFYDLLSSNWCCKNKYLDARFDIVVLAYEKLAQLQYNTAGFREVLAKCVESLIISAKLPLKIYSTRRSEIVIVPVGMEGYSPGDLRNCWKTAFTSCSRAELLVSTSGDQIEYIFDVIEQWLADNPHYTTSLCPNNIFKLIFEIVENPAGSFENVRIALLTKLNAIYGIRN